MKRKLLTTILIATMSLSISACGGNTTKSQETKENSKTEPVVEEAVKEDETETDPLGFPVTFSSTYRNDVTGNWRLSKIAENIDIQDYALEYYKNYFKADNEVHIIINFTRNSTTRINVMGNILDVTIMDYVSKEMDRT